MQLAVLKDQVALKDIQIQTTIATSGTQLPQHPIENPWELDVAGKSSPVQDPIGQSYEGEQDLMTPNPSDAERELYEAMIRERKRVVKDCMEWERRILHSAALTFLTPESIGENYYMPTLPYPLLKQEVLLLKQRLLPQCPTNEIFKWRQIWLQRDRLFKLHYVTVPQHVRIDPTFCPI